MKKVHHLISKWISSLNGRPLTHLSKWLYAVFLTFIKEYFISLFLERGERRAKERERNITVWLPLMHPPLGTWPTTQACALTGNQTGDPLVCRVALNPPSHTSQGCPIFNVMTYKVPKEP